ncbi:MAG TPA: hypothetical protein VFY20_00520 [Gemmatimonadales bacterium]|nr:hypothetical protein [Gemmatimonadales bacterium]
MIVVEHRSARFLAFGVAATLVLGACGQGEAPPAIPIAAVDTLPAGTATYDEARGELVLEMPPTDVPAAMGEGMDGMITTPASRVDIPVGGFVHSFRIECVDQDGNVLPPSRLHHINIIDPSRRELFAPISLRFLAAGKETGSPSVPDKLVGMPLIEGQRVIVKAMLHNPETKVLPGVRARVIFGYRKAGGQFPLFHAYPWQLDVKFPVGEQPGGTKAFELPAGHSETSYEASPVVPGTLVGIGGHVHDLAKHLEFKDVTTGEVIWKGEPVFDKDGAVQSMPTKMFYSWNRMGVKLDPSHTYRVTVVYDNTTGGAIPYGGMGVVAGLFLPAKGAKWPAVDTTNADYKTDLGNTLEDGNKVGEIGMMHSHHVHRAPAADSTAAAPAEDHGAHQH